MHSRDRFFVGGGWVVPSRTGVIEIVNPATELVMGRVPEGGPEDVERAVSAARGALAGWSATPAAERAEWLARLQSGLLSRMHELGLLISEEMGMPQPLATLIQAGLPAMVMGSYAEMLGGFQFEEEVGHSLVVKEPAGVVGAITPWNYPLHLAVAKVAPALAAGCTVVLKPSELAPLTAFVLAELAEEVGLPPGVLNVVTGRGPAAGEALAASAGVDLVSFTGSTRTGARVAALAAPGVKRVALELGGKSPNVILDDADLPEAVKAGVSQCFLNSGQTCSAWSRMLVPRRQHDEAADIAREVAEGFTVGDPSSGHARLGPVVSSAQRERVRAHIRRAMDDGAHLVTGGPQPPEGLDRGWYVRPTIFAEVDNSMALAQEEVFGPVLAVIPHDGDDDAVRIANDTPYGLHGAVFSGDTERALGVARRLRTGQVDVNGAGFNHLAPWGGFKRSGRGRELGREGLEEYLETKTLQR